MERGLQEEPIEYEVYIAFSSTHSAGSLFGDQSIKSCPTVK